ncbi:MAG: hypothetical protein WCJ33_02870 [Pseudomonadota bacterium]
MINFLRRIIEMIVKFAKCDEVASFSLWEKVRMREIIVEINALNFLHKPSPLPSPRGRGSFSLAFLFCLILPSISFAEQNKENDVVTYGVYDPFSKEYYDSMLGKEIVYDVFSQPQIGNYNYKQKIGAIGLITIDKLRTDFKYSGELKEYWLVYYISSFYPQLRGILAFSNRERKSIPDWVQIGFCKKSQFEKSDAQLFFVYSENQIICHGNLLYGWINKKNVKITSWDDLYKNLESNNFMPSIKNNERTISSIKLNDFYLRVKNKKYSELSNDLKEIIDYFLEFEKPVEQEKSNTTSVVDRDVYESPTKSLKIGVITHDQPFTVIKKLKNKLLVFRIPTEEIINENILAGWIDMYDDKDNYVIRYSDIMYDF